MKRKAWGMLAIVAGLSAFQPAGLVLAQALAQTQPLKHVAPPKPDVPVSPGTEPSSFADGVKAMLLLDYAGMSKEALSKATAWPLTFMDAAWPYKGKVDKGDDYLYGGSDVGGAFSLSYSEIYIHNDHHFVVQALAARSPLPEGNGCLRVRDLRPYAARAHWSDIQNYVSMMAHGFTAQKGPLILDVRVDRGTTDNPNPNLDDEGCVSAVRIKDIAPAG